MHIHDKISHSYFKNKTSLCNLIYFPISHDKKELILMKYSQCDGTYSWHILPQKYFVDDISRE